MVSLTDVVCPGLPGRLSLSFDGGTLCVISDSKDDICAFADLICKISKPILGEYKCDFPAIPFISRDLPSALTVKEYLDAICKISGKSLSSYSHELTDSYADNCIGGLSEYEKATVALGALFSEGSIGAFALGLTSGLRQDQRNEVMEKMLFGGHSSFIIYTSDSEAELRKSEYTLALSGGCQIFFGKTEDFIKKATGPSTVTVRVMGELEKASAFFESHGASVEKDIKKNVYKATLAPSTDIDKLKTELSKASLHFIDAKQDSDKISRLYCTLLENDAKLSEEYEQYKFENAGPKKLELSDFIFDDQEDDEGEDSK